MLNLDTTLLLRSICWHHGEHQFVFSKWPQMRARKLKIGHTGGVIQCMFVVDAKNKKLPSTISGFLKNMGLGD